MDKRILEAIRVQFFLVILITVSFIVAIWFGYSVFNDVNDDVSMIFAYVFFSFFLIFLMPSSSTPSNTIMLGVISSSTFSKPSIDGIEMLFFSLAQGSYLVCLQPMKSTGDVFCVLTLCSSKSKKLCPSNDFE